MNGGGTHEYIGILRIDKRRKNKKFTLCQINETKGVMMIDGDDGDARGGGGRVEH